MSISIIKAENKHIHQLARLLSYTGYDIAVDKHNTLGMETIDYISEYKIKPLLDFIYVAVENINSTNVLGMIEAGPLSLVINSEKEGHYPEIINKIGEEYYKVYEENVPESYHIFRFSVHPDQRKKGIGSILFNYAEKEAKRIGSNLLTLIVWNNQLDAIRFYLKNNMEIKNCYYISEKLEYPILLYLEKDFNKKIINNYFESHDYLNINILKQ